MKLSRVDVRGKATLGMELRFETQDLTWGRVENWRAYVRVRWQCPALSLRASVRLP